MNKLAFKQKLKKFLRTNFQNFFVESRTSTLTKTRLFSGNFRILPDFIIIGVQKCGTTSLYEYMTKHPEIKAAITKQPHYFDANYEKNLVWYKAHFPTKIKKIFNTKILKKQLLTGEASTDYINHPLVPKRIKNIIPNVKIIIILRDPVKRTYSHYQMNKKIGIENQPIMQALKNDLNQFEEREKEVLEKDIFYSDYFKRFQYLGRGEYARQIKKWEEFFPKNQILILKLEDLEKDPQKVLNDIFKFLKLNEKKIEKFTKINVGKYEKMEEGVKKFLEEYFESHNKELFEKYNIKF